ncbi:MAG: PIN domain-containing protein [Chloroflexi bacterium]|nr:PIN domain-containing protein [Chloroflexota bacterium]
MRIGRHTRLFFDASVLVAAAHSPQGGSALLLAACKAGGFRAQTTFVILLEALHALRRFPEESLRRFYRLLVEVNWGLLPIPPKETLEKYCRYISPKDVHVVAAAVEGEAEFLLTLDRQHILAASEKVGQAGLPIIILRPGDFIRQYYPQHEDYPHLPPSRG